MIADIEVVKIGALVAHCALFWGGDIVKAFKNSRAGNYDDRHHAHMAKHYKDTPWWWFVAVLVISFVLGIVVVVKENITLPVWAYVVSLLIGIIIAPLVSPRLPATPQRLIAEYAEVLSAEHDSLCPLRQWHCDE